MRISDWSSDVCSSDLPARATRQAERDRAVPGGAGAVAVDALEEAAGLQLRQGRLVVGLHHLGHWHARSPQAVDDLVAAQPGAPAAELLVAHVVLRSPTGCAGGRRVAGPSGGAPPAAAGAPLPAA